MQGWIFDASLREEEVEKEVGHALPVTASYEVICQEEDGTAEYLLSFLETDKHIAV